MTDETFEVRTGEQYETPDGAKITIGTIIRFPFAGRTEVRIMQSRDLPNSRFEVIEGTFEMGDLLRSLRGCRKL